MANVRKNPAKRKTLTFRPLATLYACLVYLFLYLPIIVVVVYSFNTSKRNVVFEGFTLSWYGEMFQNTLLMQSFYNTVIVAACSTLLSVLLGTLCAFGLYKFEFKLKGLINSAIYIPIIIPELVLAISMLAFFSLLDISMNMATLIISHVTFSMPFVAITVRSRLAGFDHALEEAARDLGAGPVHTFFRVTLPNIFPGILSGGMLALTLSLDDVVVSYFTAGADSTTLPLKIMGMVKKGVTPDVNALSTLMILGTVLVMIAVNFVQGRMEKSTEEVS